MSMFDDVAGAPIPHYPGEAQANLANKSTHEERMRNLTVGDNLDRQIAALQQHLEYLRGIKRNLESSGLLSLKIQDLRQAMQF